MSSEFGDQPDEAMQQANQNQGLRSPSDSQAQKLKQMLTDPNSKDSLCYRMENLKNYLEKKLGFDAFFTVYQIISQASESEADDYDQSQVKKILGEENMGYLNVIVQLIIVEQ